MFNKLLLVAGLSLVLISRLGESRISARRHHRAEHGEEAELTSEHEEPWAHVSALLGVKPDQLREPPAELDWSKDTGRVNPRPLNEFVADPIILAATSMLEAQEVPRNATKNLVPLSAQQVIDCCKLGDIIGCLGKLGGIESAADYPLDVWKGDCKFDKKRSLLDLKGSRKFSGDEEALKLLVANYGPVMVTIRYTDYLRTYTGGVYSSSECANAKGRRSMLLVGYGSQHPLPGKQVDYWKLRPFTAHWWGEKGFLRLKRGSNTCRITDSAYIATF